MVKAASPSPTPRFSLSFPVGLSWLKAEPSTGQGLTEAKDIPRCQSPLCPHTGARQIQMYPLFSWGNRIWGLQVQRGLRGGDRVALAPAPPPRLSLHQFFQLINGALGPLWPPGSPLLLPGSEP